MTPRLFVPAYVSNRSSITVPAAVRLTAVAPVVSLPLPIFHEFRYLGGKSPRRHGEGDEGQEYGKVTGQAPEAFVSIRRDVVDVGQQHVRPSGIRMLNTKSSMASSIRNGRAVCSIVVVEQKTMPAVSIGRTRSIASHYPETVSPTVEHREGFVVRRFV
jgi:hypothetical protein